MAENEKGEEKQPSGEDFAKSYQELCERMGYRILVVPTYVARDDGTFSTRLEYTVGKLQKQEG